MFLCATVIIKLAQWVSNQRKQYTLFRDGKTSTMTALRIQELESLGFECVTIWEDRLGEKFTGTVMFLAATAKTPI
jgi:hypothetical protein